MATEFEKEVRQKMDELRLRPSGDVWPELKLRLHKKRKRRLLIWILPVLLVLTGTTTWILIRKSTDGRDVPATAAGQPASAAKTTGRNENMPASGDRKIPTTTNNQGDINPPPSQKTQSFIEDHSIPNNSSTATSIFLVKNARKKKIEKVPIPSNDQTVLEKCNKSKEKKQAPAFVNSTTGNVPVDTGVVMRDSPDHEIRTQLKQDKANNDVDTPALSSTITTPASPDTMKVKKQIRKWKLSVEAGISRTSVPTGNSRADQAAGIGSPIGPFPVTGSTASPLLPSIGLKAGIHAKKDFSRHTGFITGIDLSLYQNRQRVGVFVDSAINYSLSGSAGSATSFYRAGSSNITTNSYLYLQVPLLLSVGLLNSTNHHLTWDNGMLPGIRLYSKSVTYSSSDNVYLRTNSNVNDFTVSFQSGLNWSFTGNQGRTYSTGLFYERQLTNTIRGNTGTRFSTFGLKFGINLKK